MTAALRQTAPVDLKNQGAMDVQTREISLARDEAALHGQESGKLQAERSARDSSLPGMDEQLRSILVRSRTGTESEKLAGASGCSGKLRADKLLLDHTAGADVVPGRCAQSALAESFDAGNTDRRASGTTGADNHQAPGGMRDEHGTATGQDVIEAGDLDNPQRRIVAVDHLEQAPRSRSNDIAREGQAWPVASIGAAPREAAPRRPGRPIGTYSPLTIWLRGVIKELRRERFTCRQVFYRIGVAEEMDDDEQGFTVTAETSDFVWRDCCGDIAGKRVTWENFRKLWQKI